MAFPTTGVLDTFNRANGPVGANWTNPALGDNAMNVVSNAATSSTSGFGGCAWAAATFGPNLEAFFDIASAPGGGIGWYLGVYDGTDSTPTGYYVRVFSDGGWNVFRSTAGAGTSLGSAGSGSLAAAIGDSVGLERNGTGIAFYYKLAAGAWASIFSTTDATHDTTGYVLGIEVTNNTITFDNFGGGTIGAATQQFLLNEDGTHLLDMETGLPMELETSA